MQPSLSETNLNIFTRGGPANPGFNEFTPIFERNQAQLNTTGEVGNNSTRGGETVISGIYDWLSLSAGQYNFVTDGFRKNFRIDHGITDLFAQAAITPDLNMQAEFRRRRLDTGDVQLRSDPDIFFPQRQRDLDQDTGRLGVRYSTSSRSDLIASMIYSRRHEKIQNSIDGDLSDSRAHQDGLQSEAQYIYRGNAVNMVGGFMHYDIDTKLMSLSGPVEHGTWTQQSAYLYSTISLPPECLVTLGLSYDNYSDFDADMDTLSPKIGLQCNVTDWLRLRVAAFQSVKPALVANQTIQPTQVAGFNQFFDDINGAKAWLYGAGVDTRLTEGVYGGTEFFLRRLDQASRPRETTEQRTFQGYLYLTPYQEWVVSGTVSFDVIDGLSVEPTRVITWSLPLTLGYFDVSGFFGQIGSTFVHQDVDASAGLDTPDGNDNFATIDAVIGYRFPRRRGLLSLEARNIMDSRLKFRDDQFRTRADVPAVSPFIPEQSIIARLTMNF